MNLPSVPRREFERRQQCTQEAMQPAHFEPACVLVPAHGELVLITGPETAAHAEIVAMTRHIVAAEEFGL